ncbi:hypothetical protein SAY86_030102 [Trapa natans]|uniref:Uncharacterized protein n=1 Tax=Trapa natans TaxID=22666 RepID=A0AAN7RGT3_TRANT|nr:hypothetical protein SAY86_030102 [Trapa natans]
MVGNRVIYPWAYHFNWQQGSRNFSLIWLNSLLDDGDCAGFRASATHRFFHEMLHTSSPFRPLGYLIHLKNILSRSRLLPSPKSSFTQGSKATMPLVVTLFPYSPSSEGQLIIHLSSIKFIPLLSMLNVHLKGLALWLLVSVGLSKVPPDFIHFGKSIGSGQRICCRRALLLIPRKVVYYGSKRKLDVCHMSSKEKLMT